ncbi:MAG TPA: hypothetical protein VFJ61_05945 [Solirubrobacterales bacterium]|nr:hypothetical protein [Solirubrobacterales bacterium]
MQLNKVGISLIAFFGLGGLAVALSPLFVSLPAEAVLTMVLLGGIWALTAFGLVLYARHSQRKGAHQDWIFQQGLRGTATVLSADSHAKVNEMPLMSLRLELELPGQGAREVRRREIMPVFAAARMQPGLVLPVYVNPGDPSDYILVW